MYTYGIAKIEINSCNKESYTYKAALVSSFILANTQREPKDECCVSWCTCTYIHMQPLTPRQPLRFTHI